MVLRLQTESAILNPAVFKKGFIHVDAFLLTMSGWSLSPMFDVNPEPTGDELSLNVDETDNRIRIELAISVAERFGIPKKEAEDIAYDIRKTVADRWKYLAKSCGLSRGQIEAMAPAFTEDYCNQKAYS